MESIVYLLWLSLKVGLNTSRCLEMLEEYGSAEAIYNKAFDEKDILSDKDLTAAKKELDKCNEERVCLVSYEDEIYPDGLRDAENPPLVLYCKGNMSLLKRPLLTVAGSRKCSQEGKLNTRRFLKTVCGSNIVPVSAFSAGIEAEVCRCVDEVVVFLPCGIDKTYPAKQFSLKNRVLKNGGLIVTQQPLQTGAFPQNIVSRNYLIAAISPCTFIVEAGDNSGTEIIFDKCLEYGNRGFVIPGNINSPFYIGSNSFIKKGGCLVTEPQEIINFYTVLYPDDVTAAEEAEANAFVPGEEAGPGDPAQKAIFKALAGNRFNYDELVDKSGLSAPDAASAITMLEMMGVIENIGGYFAVKQKGNSNGR